VLKDLQHLPALVLEHQQQAWRSIGEDHVWFEDRWMVASLCDG
jgi:hypothetical protein